MKQRSLLRAVVSIAALSAAIWFWLGDSPIRPYVLVVMVVPMVSLLAHYFYFITLPGKLLANRKGIAVDVAWRRKVLRWIVATPSLMGEGMKSPSRYQLFLMDQASGRYEEAVAQGRIMLTHPTTPGIESDLRRRMADCLDLLGRVDEAAEQRRLASECLLGAEVDFLERLSTAKALQAKNRHADAYDAFEQGLGLIDESPIEASVKPAIRLEFMIHLVLSSFNAGRPRDTVRWAETAIEAGGKAAFLLSAHRMAVVAYGNLGDLDRAESHARRALAIVEPSGNAGEIVKALASLAGIEMKRGKLAEADLSCRKAEAIGRNRELYANWAEVLRMQGRFEEALGRLRQHLAEPPMPNVAAERRIRSAVAVTAATIESSLRRWSEAEARLAEVGPDYRSDPKLGLSFEAAVAQVLAGQGRRDEAIEAIDRCLDRIGEFPDDRSTRMGVFGRCADAAFLLADYQRAEHLWTLYLETSPDPIYRPLVEYRLGETRLGLGRVEEARASFERAVAYGIDSHHARLARKRLDDPISPSNRESLLA